MFEKLFGQKKVDINLVIGINQVDNLGPWNEKINLPTPETKKEIESRAKDIKRKLSFGEMSVDKDQIDYYSALRAFRLHELNGKITKYCKDGVLMINTPLEFFDKKVATGMDERVRSAAEQKMREEDAKIEAQYGIDSFLAKLAPYIGNEDLRKLKDLWHDATTRPVRVGVLGKSGVGKSITVNNLFQGVYDEEGSKTIPLNTSRIGVGNAEAQYKKYNLPKGGTLTIVDLPGYGRAVAEDETYQEIYLRELKDCDIIIMIVQANSSDLADDQVMVQTLIEWKKAGLI